MRAAASASPTSIEQHLSLAQHRAGLLRTESATINGMPTPPGSLHRHARRSSQVRYENHRPPAASSTEDNLDGDEDDDFDDDFDDGDSDVYRQSLRSAYNQRRKEKTEAQHSSRACAVM